MLYPDGQVCRPGVETTGGRASKLREALRSKHLSLVFSFCCYLLSIIIAPYFRHHYLDFLLRYAHDQYIPRVN